MGRPRRAGEEGGAGLSRLRKDYDRAEWHRDFDAAMEGL